MYLVIQTLFPESSKRIVGLYSTLQRAKDAIQELKSFYVEKGYTNADHDSFDWICLTPDVSQDEWIRFG